MNPIEEYSEESEEDSEEEDEEETEGEEDGEQSEGYVADEIVEVVSSDEDEAPKKSDVKKNANRFQESSSEEGESEEDIEDSDVEVLPTPKNKKKTTKIFNISSPQLTPPPANLSDDKENAGERRSYSPQEVKELESKLAAKQRALMSNENLLRRKSNELPDKGKKLKEFMSKLQTEHDELKSQLKIARENVSPSSGSGSSAKSSLTSLGPSSSSSSSVASSLNVNPEFDAMKKKHGDLTKKVRILTQQVMDQWIFFDIYHFNTSLFVL